MNKKFLITGDTHGDLSLRRFLKAKEIGCDYLIVLGDFGYLWDNSKSEQMTLDCMAKMPYTILWIDGNHDNFNLLNNYPEVVWNGGKVHMIRDNIIHLKRGEVFEIDDKKFFTFGGAKSIDIDFRTLGVDYWEEEQPSKEEMENGLNNLKKHNFKVDYVLTHTCPTDTLKLLIRNPIEDELSYYLSDVKNKLSYKKWYFGHLHFDVELFNGEHCLYRNIVSL